ncbi:hypothetical protein SETIT_2G330700v2 [Setaria italica]|uniref:GYF domain-containing protein n=1 Tax=Setaria italica TaxID=4555 RepID=K3ZT62_SETIT|nr:uncharacterized protein LOC101784384 [Setaria italica]RCV13232.1 hypothetical protein SETIT_2G330700v2 [Setaria italica]
MAGPEPIGHRPWLSSPLDDDDPLSEILRRLPPRPSSLPQASLVCKRWRDLAASPQFLRDFRVFHRAAAPLLGFFHNTNLGGPDRRFVAAADPPDRVPAALFRMPCGRNHKEWKFLDCRHGRVLLIGSVGPRREVLVWDPMTGARRCTPVPPDAGDVRQGAVLCSCGLARDCRSSPFRVVLVWWIGTTQHWRVAAAIYSSESDAWSHVISVETQLAPTVLVTQRNARKPGVLVGDAVYWLLPESRILEFDTVRRSLSLISGPVHSAGSPYWQSHLVLTEVKELGYAMFMVTEVSIKLWKRDTGNAAGWSMHRSVRLDKCLPRMPMQAKPSLLGFHEESNAIFVWINAGLFLIQLESMQSRMLCQGVGDFEIYPFSGFYHRDAAGTQADDACSHALPIATLTMWHYEDPQGDLHGPFSMAMLHSWRSNGFFPEDLRVWRTDETKEQAVLLTDAMRMPCY